MPGDRREDFYCDSLRGSAALYGGFDLLSAETALNVHCTYDILHQQLARRMSEVGLSKSTANILLVLRHGPPEGMQLHDLGELLLVSKASITGLIDHLEKKGYVKRIIDAQDRRARYARITPKAEALLDKFMPTHYENIRILLQDLSNKEKQALVDLLRKARLSLAAHSHDSARVEPVGYEGR